jgi:hypothetical protein
MRFPKLIVALTLATAAFAASASSAWAHPGTRDLGAVPNGTTAFSVHINEPRTIPEGSVCGTKTTDPDDSASPAPLQQCGHVVFGTTVAGDVSGTITFNTGPDALNLFSLAFCAPDPLDVACMVIDENTNPTTCTRTQNPEAPDANQNVTLTLRCTGLPADNYELLVVPNFFSNCGLFDVACVSLVGTDIFGSLTFTAAGATSSHTGDDGVDKITGGGEVGKDNHFSVKAVEGLTNPKGHVRLKSKGICSVRSKSLAYAIIDTVGGNGHARLHGRGITKTAQGQYEEDFDVEAYDNGDSMPDSFQLTAPHCSNASPIVTKGGIKIRNR